MSKERLLYASVQKNLDGGHVFSLKSPDDHRGCDNSLSRNWWDWDESQACDGIRMILQIEVRPR